MSLSGCNAEEPSAGSSVVRPAAVAGQFYPANPRELQEEVGRYLAQPHKGVSGQVRMLISPHAGYVFSAPVAAAGFAALDSSFSTVILLGPSHYVAFTGVSIAAVDYYETPLGKIALDHKAVEALRRSPTVKTVNEAHTREHCLEVQLPFIQQVLTQATIVPIIMGRVDPKQVADLIEPLLTPATLVVASSDLSHYHTSSEAQRRDARSIETILQEDTAGFIDACGEGPIRVLIEIGRRRGWKPVLLDARNSHQTAPQYGPADRVVGYASVAFVESESASDTPDSFSPHQQSALLALARASLDAAVNGRPAPEPDSIVRQLNEPRGCFVTLTVGGQLRGCIGYIEPIKPLWEAVADNAASAALRDHRFPKVKPEELQGIRIEISVLTIPKSIQFSSPQDLLAQVVAGRDGIILSRGFHQSTFLPQVWEQLPEKIQFFEHLARKGGMGPDGWKSAAVKRYCVTAFEEE